MSSPDCIVLGVGGMGSAALYHLAGRGLSVLGIEQFDLAHDRGSSHGHTRLIRKSYFEHPDYVPLVHRAYDFWKELEDESGDKLFHRTGLLLAGPPRGAVVAGVRRAAREHNLDIEEMAPSEVDHRFAGFSIKNDMAVLYEADAGYLAVEQCVRSHARLASAKGARVLTGEAVQSWSADQHGVIVTTEKQTYRAGRLVICAGAWSGRLLADLNIPLEIRRKVVMWFDADDVYRRERGCPVFGISAGGEFFYGFPIVDEQGLKVAVHTGGEVVPDPSKLDREFRESDGQGIGPFLAEFLPRVRSTPLHTSVCMYTMTPDEHFIIDQHPEHAHVCYAAGFSGHGFKFAPVVGAALADLVIDGFSDLPIGFLSAARPALNR